MLAACWALTHIQPLLGTGQVAQKDAYFAQHSAEFNTIFIGSSRVNRQIDPMLFDEVTAAHGEKTRSYNLGIDGMFAFEDSFFAERIFAARPLKLRYVFLEPAIYLPSHAERFPDTARGIYWHDLKRTSLVVQELLDIPKPSGKKRGKWKKFWTRLPAKWPSLSVHLIAFGKRATNLGRGSLLLSDAFFPVGTSIVQSETSTGFDPFKMNDTSEQPALLRTFDEDLAKVMVSPAKPSAYSPEARRNLSLIMKLIRNSGATPIFLISPSPSPLTYYPPKEGTALLDFSDPRRWPNLYLRDERHDVAHFNASGAERYTKTLAEEWLKLRRSPDPRASTDKGKAP